MHIDNSVFRKNWIIKTLKKIPKGENILDAGAGEQQYKVFCKHLKYVSQDFCKFEPKNTKIGTKYKKWETDNIDIISDIINIPVRNSSFDNILCTEVLEHIPDPIKAIKEFSRIIKPKGSLIITAPFCSLTHMAPHYYSNGFSEFWYKKHLRNYGFTIKELSFNGNYFQYLIQELERIKYIKDQYTKPPKYISLLFLIFKIALLPLIINFIKLLNKYNHNQSERLLCFGIHIIAIKDK